MTINAPMMPWGREPPMRFEIPGRALADIGGGMDGRG